MASERDLAESERDFSDPRIPDQPTFVSDQIRFVMDKLVAQSVHIASPSFVGHMTSALPHFMLPLSRIMTAPNQNLVKVETSKAFTPLERQVIGMIHHLVCGEPESFYQRWMHDREHAIGSFCSGGTIANLTALWAARNNVLRPDGEYGGPGRDGLFADMIRRRPDFELITEPELHILTYRYRPRDIAAAMEHASTALRTKVNALLNRVTRYIQKTERGHGRSFVSRSRLNPSQHNREPVVVFRVVLANMDDLQPLFREMRTLLDLPADV